MRNALFVVVLAVCASAQAQDAALPPPDPAYDRYVEAVIDAAGASRNPRVMVAAASFAADNPFRTPWPPALANKRDALAARAIRLGADDPVVWFVLAANCPLSPTACAQSQAIARLREVAPNNAVGWLLQAPGDDADANFARAASANRFDTYQGERVRALFEAASAVPAPDAFVAEVRAAGVAAPARVAHVALALGVAMSGSIEPFGEANQRCGAGRALQGSERETCIALGRLMLNRSRHDLAQRLGATFLGLRLPDGQERLDARETVRRLDWQRDRQIALFERDAYPASLLNWLHASADEQSVRRAMLSENGIPADPPPGWQRDTRSVLPAAPGGG